MKKIILIFILTFLTTIPVSASQFHIMAYGKTITSPKTNINVTFRGYTCNFNENRIGSDSIFYDSIKTLDSTQFNGNIGYYKNLMHYLGSNTLWTGTVTAYKKGFTFYNDSQLTDSIVVSYVSTMNVEISLIAIEKPPSIVVTTPSNSTIKTPIIFQWISKDSVAITAQSLWISRNNRAFTKLDTLSPTASSYSWTPLISDFGPIKFMIKASNADTCDSAISNNFNVTITPPIVTITTPPATVSLKAPKQITWTSSTVTEISFQSVKIGGTTISVSKYDRSYTWTPTSLGIDTIKIIATDSVGQITTSTGVAFTVIDDSLPKVTLTSPVGGETWQLGSSHAITWIATDNMGIARRILSVSLDSGKTWVIFSDASTITGTFNFTLPDFEGNPEVRIVVFDATGNKDSATSGIFYVKNPTGINFKNKNVTGNYLKINGQILKHCPYQEGIELIILNLRGQLLYQGILNSASLKIPYSGECLIQTSFFNKVFKSKILLY